MPCQLCTERGKTWNGSDPKCAFENGVFSTDNWNCATINKLREICSDDFGGKRTDTTWEFRDDMSAGSFGCIWVPEGDEQGFYIVMSWYKRRGRVAWAYRMCDDDEPRPITLDEAMAAIKAERYANGNSN